MCDNDEKLHELLSKDTDISYGNFVFPCRLRLNPDAKYLSVQLHGSVSRGSDKSLPVFARWNYGKILNAHILSICDPTLYLNEKLTIGWYLGTKDENSMEGVVAIAERCADLIGLTRNLVVFSGSSGGGFAALQAAALFQGSKAIVINPQTDITRYPPPLLLEYVEKVSGCLSIEDARKSFGNRFNAIGSVMEAIQRGCSPRIVYVQNANEWHYQNHYLPFADTFGLDKTMPQSVNGAFMSILYAGTKEHGPEPMDVVKRINSEAIPFLLDLNVNSQMPELAIKIFIEKKTVCANIDLLNGANGIYKYACYLFRDNKLIERRSYQAESIFVFDVSGPGAYKCRGFIRDKTKAIAFVDSKVVIIKDNQ
jgi:hypothetical protein